MSRQQRPGILTFLAVMQFAGALLSLAISLGVLFIYSYARGQSGSGVLVLPGTMMGRGLVQLACAVGLWRVSQYGRWLALALAWVGVLTSVARLASGSLESPPSLLLLTGSIGVPTTPLAVSLQGIWLMGIPTIPMIILTLVYLHMPRTAALFTSSLSDFQ